MKKIKKLVTLLIMLLCISMSFTACDKAKSDKNPTTVKSDTTASYTSDTELGTGAKTLIVDVKVNDSTVTFTIHTDAKTVGDALIEHNLISGDKSEYGLYVKVVNGTRADYEADGAYWAFYKDGEYMMSGVDTTEFSDGDHYELVYTK